MLMAAIALPVLVSLFFLLFVPGSYKVTDLTTTQKVARVFEAVFITGLAAPYVEEMAFRGIIMKLIDQKWGKRWAIFAPSMAFAALHVTSMKSWNIVDFLLLLVAGTSVAVAWSLIAYRTNSIWPGMIIHSVWNFVVIGGILRIGATGYPFEKLDMMTYTLSSKSTVLTGGAFSIEASLPAIIGYLLLIALAIYLPQRKDK